ncbi:MAG: response regulator [Myxococcota bacterium]|nr:response regulator [Myxococcota bacterium]
MLGRPPEAVVVEDHDDLRTVLTQTLEHAGWNVRSFGSVMDAHLAIREALPDLVLTDMNVGELSGRALARELRLDPSTAPVVLVAMSGSVTPSPALLAMFDLFLPKPIDVETLDDSLRDLLATHRAGAATTR